MAAKFPKGSEFQAGDVGSDSGYTLVPGVRSISMSGLSADTLDATAHDTPGGFRDKVQGIKDWGSVQFECLWDPSDPLHQQFFDDFKAGTERYYNIEIKAKGITVGNFKFVGFVNNYPFSVPFDALLTLQVEITLKGDPEPELS